MDGFIVKQPYANLIISGQKEWELRSRCPPKEKLNKDVYLLSSGKILGKIKITSHWIANKKDLVKNKDKHLSETDFLDSKHISHVWEIDVKTKYSKPLMYAHPMGARVWVKNVTSHKQPTIKSFL